jgi:hypothetical protein
LYNAESSKHNPRGDECIVPLLGPPVLMKKGKSNILTKLGLRDRTQAALYAREHFMS